MVALRLGAGEAPPTVFESLGYLYLPSDRGVPSAVIEASPDWRFDEAAAEGLEALVWGRMPIRGSARPAHIREATRRELALAGLRLRGPGGLRLRRVHRLAPVRRPGTIKNVGRGALMGGLVVEVAAHRDVRRIVDEVARAAGLSHARGTRLRPSGDGSALGQVRPAGDLLAVLRVARSGTLKDPRTGFRGLEALAAAGVPLAPRPIAAGETHGAAWSTETALPGRIAPVLQAAVFQHVVRAATTFPRSTAPASSIHDLSARLARAFPDLSDTLRPAAAAFAERANEDQLGSVLVHGDLWLGNLLVDRDELTGIVDWDTWHPAGLPGADLFHMLAMLERSRTGWDIGDLWRSRYWQSADHRAALEPYWRQIGKRPSAAALDAVAFDWWLAQAVTALRRGRRPASDPHWVARNVSSVVEDLERLVAQWNRAANGGSKRAEVRRSAPNYGL